MYLFGSQHLFGSDPIVELLFGQIAQIDGLLLKRGAVLVRRLGNLGSLVVADVRIECRHQHQRLVHDLGNAICVSLDAVHAVCRERAAAIGWKQRFGLDS